MTRTIIAASLFALAACSVAPAPVATVASPPGVVLSQAAGLATSALPVADVAQLRNACSALAPVLGAATSSAAPASVSGTAIYPASYCAQLLSAPVGAVLATTDSGTPAWLTKTVAIVQGAAKIAGYVLPFVLPLL